MVAENFTTGTVVNATEFPTIAGERHDEYNELFFGPKCGNFEPCGSGEGGGGGEPHWRNGKEE